MNTIELILPGLKKSNIRVWITRLTSVNPNLIEYKLSFNTGVVRYMTIDEMYNSPFSCVATQVKLSLTEAIDESKIKLVKEGDSYSFYQYVS